MLETLERWIERSRSLHGSNHKRKQKVLVLRREELVLKVEVLLLRVKELVVREEVWKVLKGASRFLRELVLRKEVLLFRKKVIELKEVDAVNSNFKLRLFLA